MIQSTAQANSTHPAWSQVEEVLRHFTNVNRERLRRVREQLSPRQQDFIELLPLLLHSNHPLLPGYVGGDVPHGLPGYSPSEHTLRRAQRLVRAFTYRRRALRSMPIQAIYLMGSTGTIGQSSQSDFDIWLCHDPALGTDEVARLRAKAEAISQWAASLGLEAHFFPLTAERLRQGEVDALSSESSGSTQRHLLLDEFYRTGLLLAGRPPAWWLVPPEREHDYDECLAELTARRFFNPDDYLDFGPVANIAADEFLGATLWQLYKGIASPHKSLLKILLLESYAASYPDTELLSMRYKRALHSGERRLDALDPYVLLLRQVEGYLQALGDDERLRLARASFYLKANIQLGKPSRSTLPDARRELLQRIVDEWGWDPLRLSALDNCRRWKIDRMLAEQKSVVNALTASYRLLSAFARRNAQGSTASKRDITILGRKLFTAFEHKAGKIDLVNGGPSQDLHESHLSIHHVSTQGEPEYWLLFRGTVRPGESAETNALKRAWTLLEVVAWCHFNGVLAPHTRLLVCTPEQDMDSREVEAMATHLREHFPQGLARGASVEDLAVQPSLLAASTFININADPFAHYTRQGKQLTSARGDALSYSGWHENLVRVVDYLVVTSWRELLTFKFHGMDGLLTCLCEHLRWVARSAGKPRDSKRCESFAPGLSDTITRRVRDLFDQVTDWFLRPSGCAQRRYVLRGGQRHYVLLAQGEVVTHDFSGSYAELLRYLGRPGHDYGATTIDPLALQDTPLPQLYAGNRADVVQFYLQPENRTVQVYVLDEKGTLFTEQLPFHSVGTLVRQYERFFESMHLRQSAQPTLPSRAPPGTGSLPATTDLRAEFHLLRARREGGYRTSLLEHERSSDGGGYMSVEVIAQTVIEQTRFTLFVDGREFSAMEHGGGVFHAAASHILERRRAGERYPIYITDIDLSALESAAETGRQQTAQYLHYKRRIEEKLNQAIASRGS